jgi:hypothetical protein
VVALLSFLQLTKRVYADVIADLPSIFRVAYAMQRGQNEAAANQQSRTKCSFGANLDEVDEWLVVGCDNDHRRLSLQLGLTRDLPFRFWLHGRRPAGITDAAL